MLIGGHIDEAVERLGADIKVQGRHFVTGGSQAFRKLFEMNTLKQDGRPMVQGFLILKEIELGRMNGKATGSKGFHSGDNELHALFD